MEANSGECAKPPARTGTPAYRFLLSVSIIKIASGLILMATAAYASFQNVPLWTERFLAAAARVLVNADTFDADVGAVMVGTVAAPVVLEALMLASLRLRHLRAIRIMAVILFAFAWSSGGLWIVQMFVVMAAFSDDLKATCEAR